MRPLNHILRRFTGSCTLTISQEKFSHLIYIDDNKLFAKTEEEEIIIKSVRIFNKDVWIVFGIENMPY